MKEIIKEQIDSVINQIFTENNIEADIPEYSVEIPNNPAHGDFAASAALKLAKTLRKSPMLIAEDITSKLDHPLFESAEIANPGFINFRISKSFFHDTLKAMLSGDDAFCSNAGEGTKVLVEFVSANPTGPLHIGHGRNAAYGDSLAKVLRAAGFEVDTEYYVNDAGNQMNNLGKSIYARYMQQKDQSFAFPEDGYKGDYITDIALELLKKDGGALYDMNEAEAEAVCLKAGLENITKLIEDDLKEFRVSFDRWFSEKSLYEKGEVQQCIEELREKDYVYDHDGAVWFRSTAFGDDKDRVLKKSTGEYTYFASDIAYHRDKFLRGYNLAVDVWGSDHHGYVKRLTSSTKALGFENSETKVVLIQMVSLLEGGERISMSTRAGEFITLKWLIDEVGADAARFFYMSRAFDAQFDFDIDLAKSKSNDNPVFYVQYAHARVKSLFRKADEVGVKYSAGADLHKLDTADDTELIKKMYEITAIIEQAARNLEPHRISYYLQDLASMFHSYYFNNAIVTDDVELTNARLSLAEAVGRTIRFGLSLVGVEAPERM